MKIRNGFVSNSSSSSFAILYVHHDLDVIKAEGIKERDIQVEVGWDHSGTCFVPLSTQEDLDLVEKLGITGVIEILAYKDSTFNFKTLLDRPDLHDKVIHLDGGDGSHSEPDNVQDWIDNWDSYENDYGDLPEKFQVSDPEKA